MKFIQLSLFGPDREEETSIHPEKHLTGKEGLTNKIQETQEVAEQLVLPLEGELMEKASPS